MLKTYYYLMKPGIIMGNLITTGGAFILASKGNINGWLFLQTLAGLSLVIASGCVFNNYMDRKLDQKMERTKNRPLATGLITGKSAIPFATLLGIGGLLVLLRYTNLLTAAIALTGFLVYVILYGILKCRTIHGTIIGSVAGAIPPVVGYCAVSNHLDAAASLLFIIMVLWQMPHFFAIAMYRFKDYSAASVPLLPIQKGARLAKIHMHCYIAAFTGAALLLTYFGYTGYAYLAIASLLGLGWLYLCYKGWKSESDTRWAHQMFRFSLVVITGLFIALSFDTV